MKLQKKKKRLKSLLVYSDIDTLELYQASIMLFVNPFHLIPLSKIYKEGMYIEVMGFLSILIGLITVYMSLLGSIKSRVFAAKLHWIFCVVVVGLLYQYYAMISPGIISFYILQLCFSLFCVWRLTREQNIRIKDRSV